MYIGCGEAVDEYHYSIATIAPVQKAYKCAVPAALFMESCSQVVLFKIFGRLLLSSMPTETLKYIHLLHVPS